MCSDIFVVFERAELREFDTSTCRAHRVTRFWFLFRFGLYTGCVYDTEHEKPDYSYPCVHKVHVQVSTQQLNTVWPSICVCVLIIISHHVFHFSWLATTWVDDALAHTWRTGLHVTLSWFLSEYCLIIRFHPTVIFFFFSFVTPSCLYFVVVRNPTLTPAVCTIKQTFIYVALFSWQGYKVL